jgi:hypothetical protein
MVCSQSIELRSLAIGDVALGLEGVLLFLKGA